MNKIKCMLLVLVFGFNILSSVSVYADENVSVYINSEMLISDVSPQIVDGRTLVPLRATFEALGITVDWDEQTKQITGTKNQTTIKLWIDSKKSIVNETEIEISVPPMIINDRTMVPIRFISESVGAVVEWDEKARCVYINSDTQNSMFEENGIKFISKVEGKNFYMYSNGQWVNKFLKGVNVGSGKPGTFPGELAITKAEYLRWFRYISDMNAEFVRVYTTLKPEFYDALYQFNKTSKNKIYLVQGVWVNEEDIYSLNDAYADNEKIKKDFIKDSQDLVDIIHGNATLPEKRGFASGTYTTDVSEYVAAWIMGIEWDPYFIKNTNEKNPTKNLYNGNYLYTQNASPFETFLCEVGDKALQYEAEKYKTVRPISFSNWPTADMLSHPNEPYPDEDMSVFNMNNIKPVKSFTSGVFASYHIYPYYPEFINTQKEYSVFKDDTGKINTYKAYLKDLFSHYDMPVVVAEVGIPASRGMAHISPYSGFNQGYHNEKEQGEMVSSLINDIYDEGYCGGFVFAWQDEWFKRTWNTMDFDLPDSRPYWSNPQTNEQQFGLLAFDPGKEKSVCYVDGDISDWQLDTPIYSTDELKLYTKSDEKYMYFMAKTKNYDFNKDSLYIALDTINGQENTLDVSRNLKIDRPADFIIQINNEPKILVDSYYDSFYYLYGETLKFIDRNPEYTKQGNGIFNPMYLCLSKGLYLPEEKRTIPFSKYETGILTFGNANPDSTQYNSLSDYNYSDGNIEIRIPWQLLNVMDPSTKSIMSDLYKNKGIKSEKVDGFYVGGVISKDKATTKEIKLNYFTWEPWYLPTSHERLKPSYYIIKSLFEKL